MGNPTNIPGESSNPYENFQKIDIKEDIFRQIFEYSIIPILVHDMNMNILNANESAVAEFGYSKNELLMKSIFELHIEEELQHSADVLDQMKQEQKLSVETKFKRKDGSVFMAEATPCKYILGDTPIIHVFIQDITERKLSEKKLQNAHAALESEMAKVEMHSKQIQIKNKELEEFSYVAAHDLKAPMTNLTTLSDMIDVTSITDSYTFELFDKLKKNIEQLHKTVFSLNDVINFKTTLSAEKEHLYFENVFEEIKLGITENLEKSKAQLDVDFSECPTIDYPLLHLKSVLQNLLVNAIRYRDVEKPLVIKINTTKQNGRVCLIVKDNGLGFDAQKYGGKIFQLFKRLHTHVQGQGIGMYLVKCIIDEHGGRIDLQSKPKQGAMFTIYLN